MVSSPTTAGPDVLTTEATAHARKKVSCLPVADCNRLLGMITERDLIVVSAKLLETFLEQEV